MTTKAPEERSRDSTVHEISSWLKFESRQTFVFLRIATDFLFPSLQYQLPSSPNTLALKAIIVPASSRQNISKQQCLWSCNCCLTILLPIQLLGWAAAGEWGAGARAALSPLGQRGSPAGAWGERAGDGNPPGPSRAGEREVKASQKPSFHPACVGGCPPWSTRQLAEAEPTLPCSQMPWVFLGQHLVLPDRGWE